MAESIIKSPQFKTGTLVRTSGSFGVWEPTNRDVLYGALPENGLYLVNAGFTVNISSANKEVVNIDVYDRLDTGGQYQDTLLKSLQIEGQNMRTPLACVYLGRFEAGHQVLVRVTVDSGRYSNLRLLPISESNQNVWWLKLSD